MVDAVNHEVEAVRPFVVSIKVEDNAMQPVFGQRPEQPATGKPDHGAERADSDPAGDRKAANHRHEDDQRDNRMNSRETVEQVGFEHPR